MAHQELPKDTERASEAANSNSDTWGDVSSQLFASNERSEHIKLASNDNDFSKFFKDINRGINESVEKAIRDGIYIAPEHPAPGGAGKASELAEDIADRARTGLPKMTHNMPMLGAEGKERYNKDTENATKDIQKREEDIAKRQWGALSPAEQQTIAQEKYARDSYNSQTVYRTNPQPPATPHLDRFKANLAKELEPLETQRAEIYKQVWKEMPVEEKAAIIRKIEQNKRFIAK